MLHKETEFQESAIGKVPIDWDVRELGDDSIAYLIAGQSPPSSTYNKENRGLPFLQGKMEFGEIFPSPTTHCSEPIKVAEKDDILLSVRAPVGDVNIAPFKCCIGRGLAAIRPKADRLNHLFLFHYLKLEGKRFEALSTGSTFKAIRRQEIEKFAVPVPSLVEQRGIVGVLGVVDSAIELADKVIAKTERLKKGLMQHLLTHGIGHTEYKDTPIGKTPKTWQIAKLGEALELCQYGLSSRFGETGKYPILKMDDIVNGVAIPDNAKYIDLDEKTFNAFKLEKGDILFNRTNSYELVGRTGIFLLDGDYVFASYLIRLRPRKEIVDSRFLTFYITFSNDRLRQLATRAVHQANINATNLQNFKIPLPPLSEQQKIEGFISEVDKKLILETREKAKLERIKRGLMDLLLTGKVRVKVD